MYVIFQSVKLNEISIAESVHREAIRGLNTVVSREGRLTVTD